MRLRPVNDKIVIKPQDNKKEQTTVSGIILPDTVQDGILLEGKVIAVGEGMYSANGTVIPIVVKSGDKILYNKHAQLQEYNLNGEVVAILSQNEILSIVEDD